MLTCNLMMLLCEYDEVLDSLPFNTTFQSAAGGGNFVQVGYGSNQGWINRIVLTTNGDCPRQP
jgi:hypothetical protein